MPPTKRKSKEPKGDEATIINGRKVGMTGQWQCPRCSFPENFSYYCSLCDGEKPAPKTVTKKGAKKK